MGWGLDELFVGVGGAGLFVGRVETTAAKDPTGEAVRKPIDHRILWAGSPAAGGRPSGGCGLPLPSIYRSRLVPKAP